MTLRYQSVAAVMLAAILICTAGCPEETAPPGDPAPAPDPTQPEAPDVQLPGVPDTPAVPPDRQPPVEPVTPVAAAHPLEVLRQVEAGEAILLDIRTEQERERGRIRGAQWVQLSDLDAVRDDPQVRDVGELPRDKAIYAFGESGDRAQRAADILRQKGYTAQFLDADYQQLIELGFQPDVEIPPPDTQTPPPDDGQ